MIRKLTFCSRFLLACGLALAAVVPLDAAQAMKPYEVLYTFQDGGDGYDPNTGLVMDAAGNLYGGDGAAGIYKLAPDGTQTVLYVFKGGKADGNVANDRLIVDAAGNLYGMTQFGGSGCKRSGCGIAFRIAPDGTETILHVFESKSEGQFPRAGLLMDGAGNLYGTTFNGGGVRCHARVGCGTVFKLTPGGTLTTLYAFKGGSDGNEPDSSLIVDGAGNLYGTTALGGGAGCGSAGCGTVFRLAPDGTETVLYAFTGTINGNWPYTLVADAAGNLYGTTRFGGSAHCLCGVVFKLAPNGAEITFHAFAGGADGAYAGGLIVDGAGNLYGTTQGGGKNGTCCGTVFKLAPDRTETILHAFVRKNRDGFGPAGAPVTDTKGNLYGAASYGGVGRSGTVFAIKP
jgi:uncharacterized repeat protein (TIGR03803 family)